MTYAGVLKRALLASLVVGVLAGAYMLVAVEPVIDRAIALEEQLATGEPADDGHDHHHEPLYSRGEQKGGGFGAMVLYALALGLVFGTVFAWRRHGLPGATDFVRAVWLAVVGFAMFGLLPAVKYPATPPGVGDPDTVGERTLQYVGLIALALVATIALARLSKFLRSRVDDPTRVVAVASIAVVAFALAYLLLPDSPDEIAAAIPAELVWDFRLRSLGGLAITWLGFGLLFGWFLSRPPAAGDDLVARPRSVRATS